MFPERSSHIGLDDPVDTQAELEFRGCLNLRVRAAEVVSDTDNSVGARTRGEE